MAGYVFRTGVLCALRTFLHRRLHSQPLEKRWHGVDPRLVLTNLELDPVTDARTAGGGGSLRCVPDIV